MKFSLIERHANNKKPLSLIALALFAMLTFFGCGAKQTPPPTAAEAPAVPAEAEMLQESVEATEIEIAPDAPMAEESMTEEKGEEMPPLPTVPEGSVLHLIPEQTLGLIYCPSLAELDARLNALVRDLMPPLPTMTEPPELLASILADAFGAGFESLEELEEIGLDLNRDFAIFFTSLEPMFLSATVHLLEPAAIMQVIEMEAEGTAPVDYNGVTYWNAAGGGGSFAILDDVLVFSQQATVCENAIDTHQARMQSVTMNADYAAFLSDVVPNTVDDTNQLAVHFDFETVAPLLSASLQEELEGMVDSMESAPESAGIVPMVQQIFGSALSLIEEVKTLSLTLQVEGTDVQIASSLAFIPDGKLHKALGEINAYRVENDNVVFGLRKDTTSQRIPSPNALRTTKNVLPEHAAMSGAMQVTPKTLLALGKFGFKFVPQDTPEQKAMLEPLFERMRGFYEALTGDMAYAVNFSDSLVPDSLIVYGIQDVEKVRAYMDEGFVAQMQVSMQLMRGMLANVPNVDDVLGMYEGAGPGPSEMHNSVEIKSYTFPNFGKVFAHSAMPDIPLPFPTIWNCYYAFTEEHLFLVMGSSPQLLKDALDGMAGSGTTLVHHPSYQHLTKKLGTDNNVFYAISPIIALKSWMPLLAKMDPGNAAAMQMFSGMLTNLPDNYSIGFAAKARKDGMDTKLLITLGDFRQLIQMIAMMAGGERG